VQRCHDVNVDVFACFLDYKKVFDTVKHNKLINIFQELGLDGRDICIIANLLEPNSNYQNGQRMVGRNNDQEGSEIGMFSHCCFLTCTRRGYLWKHLMKDPKG